MTLLLQMTTKSLMTISAAKTWGTISVSKSDQSVQPANEAKVGHLEAVIVAETAADGAVRVAAAAVVAAVADSDAVVVAEEAAVVVAAVVAEADPVVVAAAAVVPIVAKLQRSMVDEYSKTALEFQCGLFCCTIGGG
jgi:hypothetical protein